MVNWDRAYVKHSKHVKFLGLAIMYQETHQELLDLVQSLHDENDSLGDTIQAASLRSSRVYEENDKLRRQCDDATKAFRDFEESVKTLTNTMADKQVLLDEAIAQIGTYRERMEMIELMLSRYRDYRNATRNRLGPKAVKDAQQAFYDSLDTIEVMVNTPLDAG